jgi:DNA primase
MTLSELVKNQVDIVRTVGDYVRLRKLGARYVALCPFHTEKTPSFSVNPSMQIFICFGCGVKGDVFKFVQEIEQIPFFEALKLLAERNGIALPSRRERHDPETELRAAILEMHEIAARAFADNLASDEGADARAYVRKRGLSEATAGQFGLGYASRSGQDLTRRLRQQFDPEQLEKSGLVSRRQDGGFFDRFRGRLMFPIHNESAKVIGFGGRALRDDDEPKYLNSPETPVYKKSNVLYNLHRAKEAMRKSDRAVLVEGYMDVIGVYAAGIRNVVASCGTALTAQQVRSIKRHTENIAVNFDPDAAGAKAAERSVQTLLDEGLHVRILELEDGLDPDEYIAAHGPEKYLSRLERAAGYFIWLADRARSQFDMSRAEERVAGFETLLAPAIRRVSDRLERAAIATEVADYLQVDRSLVLEEFRRTPAPRKDAKTVHPTVRHNERILLRSLVASAEIRETLLPRLRHSAAARKYAVWPVIECMISSQDSAFSYENLESTLPEREKSLLTAALLTDNSDEVFTKEQALAYLTILESDDAKLRIMDLRERIKQAEREGDLAGARQLTVDLLEMQRRKP